MAFLGSLEGWEELFMRRYVKTLKQGKGDGMRWVVKMLGEVVLIIEINHRKAT